MTRLPYRPFRLAAWITALVFLGSGVLAPRAPAREQTAWSFGHQDTIRQAASLSAELVSTHTFVAKPVSVSLPWSSLDVPFISAAQRRLIVCAGNSSALRTIALNVARLAWPTLVGVVEFRI